LTFGLSIAAAAAGAIGLAIVGASLLNVLGGAYADAAEALSILAIAAVPMVVKQHFQVLMRIRGQLRNATIACAIGGVLELVGAAVGLTDGGLVGLALGWLAALGLEAATMAIPLARTAFAAQPPRDEHGQRVPRQEA
jgi:hypothetical protein